jgi:hypothetical protein
MKKQGKLKPRSISTKYKMGPILSRHEVEEFGPGKVDIIFCPEGEEVYYYKSWHHGLADYPYLKENKPVRFKLCPFHEMKKNHQWEGEIRVLGLPEKYQPQIVSTAEGLSREAYRRDPMHRILDIKTSENEIKIYVSENQLTQKISKKIFQSLKNHFSKPKIHKGRGADPVLITMEWLIK